MSEQYKKASRVVNRVNHNNNNHSPLLLHSINSPLNNQYNSNSNANTLSTVRRRISSSTSSTTSQHSNSHNNNNNYNTLDDNYSLMLSPVQRSSITSNTQNTLSPVSSSTLVQRNVSHNNNNNQEWKIIYRDINNQRIVLYQPDTHQILLYPQALQTTQHNILPLLYNQSVSTSSYDNLHSNNNMHYDNNNQHSNTPNICPTCLQPLRYNQQQRKQSYYSTTNSNEPYMSSNYFHLLQASITDNDNNNTHNNDDDLSSSMCQGYYKRFFRELYCIGRGASSICYACDHVLNNVIIGRYAVKKIAVGHSTQWLYKVLNEVRALSILSHPYIISYKHSWVELHIINQPFGIEIPVLFLCTELADRGTLNNMILTKNNVNNDNNNTRQHRSHNSSSSSNNQVTILSELQIWQMISQISDAVSYLHDCNIVHRDLKCDNIFLKTTNNNNIKCMIGDLGNAIIKDTIYNDNTTSTGNTGTLLYTAPELLQQQLNNSNSKHIQYNELTDMYSIGVILYAMTFNILPYNEDTVETLYNKQRHSRLTINNTYNRSNELLQTIHSLLSINPNQRMPAQQLYTLSQQMIHKLATTQQQHHQPSATIHNTNTVSYSGHISPLLIDNTNANDTNNNQLRLSSPMIESHNDNNNDNVNALVPLSLPPAILDVNLLQQHIQTYNTIRYIIVTLCGLTRCMLCANNTFTQLWFIVVSTIIMLYSTIVQTSTTYSTTTNTAALLTKYTQYLSKLLSLLSTVYTSYLLCTTNNDIIQHTTQQYITLLCTLPVEYLTLHSITLFDVHHKYD